MDPLTVIKTERVTHVSVNGLSADQKYRFTAVSVSFPAKITSVFSNTIMEKTAGEFSYNVKEVLN